MRLAHRVHTTASPAAVWEVLGDPERWPQFELFLRRVRGTHGRAAAGQRLMGVARAGALAVPVDVLEAVPPSRLVLLVHVAPGLRARFTYDVTPAVRGGCDLTVSLVLDGPLARPAVPSVFLAACLSVRLLAARTDRLARAARRSA